MAIEAEALRARLERAVTEIHDHITTPEGMAAWNRLNDADVAIRSALAEDTARAAEDMRERAAKVCDDRAQICESAARQWMEGEHPEPEIASSIMAGADQCEQAASEIRALPLDKEAADANR